MGLRATAIDDYRRRRATDPTLLNSRRDYVKLRELARERHDGIVFTELAGLTRIGQHRAIVDIGSRHQPFKLFVPDIESDNGRELLSLLTTRYITDTPDRIRRSYAYVQGQLKLFGDEPEIVVENAAQVTDTPPA